MTSTPAPSITRNRSLAVALGIATLALAAMAVMSLRWRMQHDSPIMLYITYLIEHLNYVPYRDVFDMNMPGAYYAYGFLGRFFSAYNDLGFRIADLVCLAAILAVTWFWMKGFGRLVAWCGAVVFGIWYMGEGPMTSLQREFLILLPIASAVYIAMSRPRMRPGLKGFLTGFLFGMAATVKTQSAVGFPVVFVFVLLEIKDRDESAWREMIRFGLLSLAGFALPFLISLVHLWTIGALSSFIDVAVNYWPLYTNLSGVHETISGGQRLGYLVSNFFVFGHQRLWLVAGLCGMLTGVLLIRPEPDARRRVVLIALLALAYSLYTVLAGKFWRYHWIPFFYFVIQLGALCFAEQKSPAHVAKKLIPILVLVGVVALTVRVPREFRYELSGTEIPAPMGGRVDQIAAFLEKNLRPGDRVQPLDWTGGALHAMLIARAEVATPFVYDFHFYHHVSNPYIRGLRDRFIESLQRSKPRFIIEIISHKPWVTGEDTTTDFNRVREFIAGNYSKGLVGRGYTIWVRRAAP